MPIPKQIRVTVAEQLMRGSVQSNFRGSWFFKEKPPLLTSKACEYIFEYARINGDTEVTEATLIFRATRDGWSVRDFHRLCDDRGPTLCLVQAEDDYISAGFTSIAWASPESGTWVEDASAMVFALTDTLQVFKTKRPKDALYHRSKRGPVWYEALELATFYKSMKDGYSHTKEGNDYGKYEVVRLPDGKNPLTGSTYVC